MKCAVCMFAWPPVEKAQDADTVINGLAVCMDHAGSLAGADETLRSYMRGSRGQR